METENNEIVKKKRFSKNMIHTALGTVIMVGIMAAMIVNGIKLNMKDNTVPVTDTNSAVSEIESDIDSEPTVHKTASEESVPSSAQSKSESSKSSSKAASSKKAESKKADSKAASSKSTSSAAKNAVSAAAQQVTTPPAPQQEETYYPEPEVLPEAIVYEEFDEDGRLIIDTDTLDGKKAIAITFDDGPSKFTAELLEGLNARGARATFFMVGSCVERYLELLPLMIEGGHQIGNHTYNHIRMTAASEYTWSNEIAVTDDAIHNACGQYATAFRPPYGSYTQYMARTVNKTFTIWSVDTLDWQSRNTDSVRANILNYSKDGSIVLLHDLYKTSVDAALQAIDILQAQGYVFVTVDELLTRYGYPISNTPHFSQYPVANTVPRKASEPETDTQDTELEPITETETDTDTETGTDIPEPATDTDTETDTVTDIPDTDLPPENDTELPE